MPTDAIRAGRALRSGILRGRDRLRLRKFWLMFYRVSASAAYGAPQGKSPYPRNLHRLLCLMLLLLPLPLFAQAPPNLDVGSTVHITVAGEPDLSANYTIDQAGDISMLYVNQVHIGGLTTDEAAKKLASKDYLGKYYRNPQVVVTLISSGGIVVEVTGAVATQGARGPIRADSHLNDVLQQSGPALDADLTKVQITHGLPGGTHTTDTVDYLSFLNSQNTAGNPLLHDGDMIFVPRKENVQILVSVRGEVAKPGRLSLAPSATAYDAIQAAGGLLTDADRKGIVIQHANTTDQIPIKFEEASHAQNDPKINPVLLDGDSIIVKAAETSNVYTITGAVRQPGEYPLTTPNFTLADALGKAGGLGDRPKLKDMTIIRTSASGHATTLKLDATDPQVQGNTLVMPGDNINIPQGTPGTHYDPLTVIGVLVSIIAIFRR